MLCPKCNKEIQNITVISKSWQKATVNSDGTINDYGGIQDILETLEIRHYDNGCDNDIKELIDK